MEIVEIDTTNKQTLKAKILDFIIENNNCDLSLESQILRDIALEASRNSGILIFNDESILDIRSWRLKILSLLETLSQL